MEIERILVDLILRLIIAFSDKSYNLLISDYLFYSKKKNKINPSKNSLYSYILLENIYYLCRFLTNQTK